MPSIIPSFQAEIDLQTRTLLRHVDHHMKSLNEQVKTGRYRAGSGTAGLVSQLMAQLSALDNLEEALKPVQVD